MNGYQSRVDGWWRSNLGKMQSQLVAGELLEICSHALSTRLDIGRIHWVQLSRYVASKKDWSLENCMKEQAM